MGCRYGAGYASYGRRRAGHSEVQANHRRLVSDQGHAVAQILRRLRDLDSKKFEARSTDDWRKNKRAAALTRSMTVLDPDRHRICARREKAIHPRRSERAARLGHDRGAQ